jgi:hypothetical protein
MQRVTNKILIIKVSVLEIMVRNIKKYEKYRLILQQFNKNKQQY